MRGTNNYGEGVSEHYAHNFLSVTYDDTDRVQVLDKIVRCAVQGHSSSHRSQISIDLRVAL